MDTTGGLAVGLDGNEELAIELLKRNDLLSETVNAVREGIESALLYYIQKSFAHAAWRLLKRKDLSLELLDATNLYRTFLNNDVAT